VVSFQKISRRWPARRKRRLRRHGAGSRIRCVPVLKKGGEKNLQRIKIPL